MRATVILAHVSRLFGVGADAASERDAIQHHAVL